MVRTSTVSLVSSDFSDVDANVSRSIELSGGLDLRDGEKVVIKINMCDSRPPETGAITHPLVLNALLKYLRRNFTGLKIIVTEGDSSNVLADEYIRWFGFQGIIEKWDSEWCNLTKEKTVSLFSPIKESWRRTYKLRSERMGFRYFKELKVPEFFGDSFFITLPTMKTHILTKMTGSLKNQFGCIPVVRRAKYHERLDDVIVDMNLALRPDFCVVDAIIGMGGAKAPAFGVPIRSNKILTGSDPVAVDCLCARIMGFNPQSIGHIVKAEKSGIGSMDYQVVGMDPEEAKVDFKWNRLEAFVLRAGDYLRKHS